jgi:hypothetical protein
MLTAPPVSAVAIEATVFALFEEWLRGYFDGGRHAIGAHAEEMPLSTDGNTTLTTDADEPLTADITQIQFPEAVLRFQQSGLPALGGKVGLTAVWVHSSDLRKSWETVGGATQEMQVARATWQFIVRAEGPANSTGDNAERRCRTAADLLHAILANSAASRPLAQKGLHRLRPDLPRLLSEGLGAPGKDLQYRARLVTCRGQLRYPIYSQT